MSAIGLFGGGGTSEELHLQRAKYKYTVLDEVDVKETNEYRRFKFLIFPSRLFFSARVSGVRSILEMGSWGQTCKLRLDLKKACICSGN
jgi:hypothetical protein